MFCWHRWEEPAYNEALNLREGLKVCQKCASVKGFKRFVPIDYESLDLQEPEPIFDLKLVITGVVMIVVGLFLVITLNPVLNEALAPVENDPMATGSQVAFVRLVPMVLFAGIIIGGVGKIISGLRMLPSDTDDLESMDQEGEEASV